MKNLRISRGDIFGGLTAGIVALPLALAFGVQSGMGPAAGLYGAIFLGFFAAAFGGTATQISGPTGPMTVVSAAVIADFVTAGGNLQSALGAIVACFVLAGLLQIVMGILKIGSLIKFIPYPVISGFMSGIGVIIILLQLFPAIGQKSPPSTVDVVAGIAPALQNVNLWALLYAALTIGLIYLFPKITKAVPSTLVALLAVTVLSVFLQADVPTIGDIPQGIPAFLGGEIFRIPSNTYSEIVGGALTLAALGSIDSLLTSVIADNVTKTRHKSNRELIGQGIGNAVGGLFGGLPGAGATMRTLVNIRSGGKTRVSGILHSVTLAVILLGVGRYAALIPNSVLAGVLITVGIGILDYRGFRHIAKVPRTDAAIMIIVLLVTVFFDLLTAVAVGMVMAALLFMKKMSDIARERTEVKELSHLSDEIGLPENGFQPEWKNKVYVKRVEGPLFFGFAQDFQRMTEQLRDIRYVLLRMENVPFIDQTGLYALEETILALEQRGIDVLLTGVRGQPEVLMRRINLIPGLVAEDNICQHFDQCAGWVRKKLEEKEAEQKKQIQASA